MYETNIDTIKFSVSLLNQIKKKGLIEIQNKLVNSGLSSLNDSNLRLLIELQSSPQDCKKTYRLQEIKDKVSSDSRLIDLNNQEKIIKKMLFLKLHVSILVQAIKQNNLNQCEPLTQQIINRVSNLQDMAYLFQILFNVKSLYFFEVLNYIKTDISNLHQANKQFFFYMIALIKINNRKQQAKQILRNQLKGKYIFEQILNEKSALLLVLKLLLEREKQLVKQARPIICEEQNSRFLYYESTRKIIKNKFFLQFKIDLDLPFQYCEKQLASLEQKSYLLALPLFHFYFESNQKVTEKLALTQINRKISVAKSVLIETLPLSTNGKNKSKSKFKFRYPRNPEIYPKYIEDTCHKSQKYIQICKAGENFVKYNYNNLYSASKFVVVDLEKLAWAKSKSDIQKNSTKIKMKNIVGLLYGKISTRLQQSREQGPCFSFLLKDRTVDLSIQKEKRETLHKFMLGASSFISKFHKEQREKVSKEIQANSNYSVVEQINNMITFHETKCSQLTHGKLFWKDLFVSLSRKAKRFESELLAKSKCIIYLANKQSLNNSKVSKKKPQL